MDVSDLYPRPLILRTLLHSRRKDNTRGVNNRCIFHELANCSNRLRELHLSSATHPLPARRPGATALPTLPIPFRSLPAFCYIPKNQ